MFTLYCDDSGTHPESDVAVAGCYVSTNDQWDAFRRNWDDANARENFDVFHMTDFVARRKQFASEEWKDQAKRHRTIEALINIIKTRARIGFAAVVVKSDYDEVIVGGDLRHKFEDNHYAFAVRLCTAMIDRWREKYNYDGSIQYVFDRMSKGKGNIDAIFSVLVKGGPDAMRRYGICEGCWSFQDKAQVAQLQAADIWAWENYRYMIDTFIPGQIKGDKPKTPRSSYLALIESPTVVKYHIKETLQKLVREGKTLLSASTQIP